jgi:TetR/AcrR family transcriptional regulator, regulator of mycofactocin system
MMTSDKRDLRDPTVGTAALAAGGSAALAADGAESLQRRRDAIKDRKAESVRAAVAEQALGLLLSAGFDETTVDDIAKTSGVGRRTFFRYFETKEAVVLWHHEQFGALAARLVGERPAAEPPIEAVHRALIEACSFYSQSPERTRNILRMVEATPSLFAQYVVQGERFKSQVSAALAVRSALPQDDLSSLLVGRIAFEALSTGLRRWLRDPQRDLAAAVDEAFRTLRNSIS